MTPEDNIIEEAIETEETENEVAVIDITGMIAANNITGSSETDMVEMILLKLQKAEENNNVKAIILRLDTPGGTVYDSDRIAKEVKRINAEKPIIAYMRGSATSGGYYIAAPTSKIIASDTTVTGSIGVIVRIIDIDGVYEKIGANVITVTNTEGEVKSMDNLDDPTSPDRKVLEAVLDDNYEAFVKFVSEGREMTRKEVVDLADGSIYSGKKAKALGLVDELGGFDTAIEAAKSEAGINEASVVEYQTYMDPWTGFGSFIENQINPLSSLLTKIDTEPGVYYYYMPE